MIWQFFLEENKSLFDEIDNQYFVWVSMEWNLLWKYLFLQDYLEICLNYLLNCVYRELYGEKSFVWSVLMTIVWHCYTVRLKGFWNCAYTLNSVLAKNRGMLSFQAAELEGYFYKKTPHRYLEGIRNVRTVKSQPKSFQNCIVSISLSLNLQIEPLNSLKNIK